MSSGRCYLKHRNDSAGAARAGEPWGVSFPKSNGVVRKQRARAKALKSTGQRGVMEAQGRESSVHPLARPWSRGRDTPALQQRPGEWQGLCLRSQPKPLFMVPWFLYIPPHHGVQSVLAMSSASASPVLQPPEEAWAQNCRVPLPPLRRAMCALAAMRVSG